MILITGLQEKIPDEVYIEVMEKPIDSLDDSLKSYNELYLSDDIGLVETVYLEHDKFYSIRIVGSLPNGRREELMQYEKFKLVTVLIPSESIIRKSFGNHYSLVEGKS